VLSYKDGDHFGHIVEGEMISEIAKGLLVLIGIAKER